MIVLVATAAFLFSMFFGPARGVVVPQVRQWRVEARIQRHHLLRAIYELLEARSPDIVPAALANGESPPVLMAELLSMRSWTPHELASYVRRAQSQGLVSRDPPPEVRLTREGLREAEKLTYDHRLWELFFDASCRRCPGTGRSHRRRHRASLLDAEMIAELESLLPPRRKMARRFLPVCTPRINLARERSDPMNLLQDWNWALNGWIIVAGMLCGSSHRRCSATFWCSAR